MLLGPLDWRFFLHFVKKWKNSILARCNIYIFLDITTSGLGEHQVLKRRDFQYKLGKLSIFAKY